MPGHHILWDFSEQKLRQLQHQMRKLQQDVKEFRNSFLVLLQSYQGDYQSCLSDITAAVQRTQLSIEALQACQSEAARLQQHLEELESRYHLEQQRRRALHNSLVVSACRANKQLTPPLEKWSTLLMMYNVCIMAYGQTGSGKSYTMLGPHSEDDAAALLSGVHEDLGIIPRATEELFRLISENPSRSPKVDVSIVEIYNNNIFDLLAKDNSTVMLGAKCQMATMQEGRSEVPRLTCRPVTSAEEFVGLIHKGVRLRVQHPTLVHKNSSRSHLIVTATLTTASPLGNTATQSSQASLQKIAGASNWWITPPPASSPHTIPADSADHPGQVLARLQLVDLAGSECSAVSGVTGLALKETSFINRSLAALADVLGALSEHCDHIPYRNSKLTHLLQDSIGLSS
ncbi:Kinesin-like protein KIF25 [Cricetulus griseus]|uniref:Kinesin-like protein n=1 Tax=Cricetulus griseus TaxID=10029 RepID=G3HK25_CRIGR|nr:Kinesin-like protein KIF25 [Cricetulus griseus]